MKLNCVDQVTSDAEMGAQSMVPMVVLPPSQPKKLLTGNMLSLHDAELQLINSGPAGMRRLAFARAVDMQELMPGLSDRDAQLVGAGYVMLRMQGMAGALTEITRAEVDRLKATQQTLKGDR